MAVRVARRETTQDTSPHAATSNAFALSTKQALMVAHSNKNSQLKEETDYSVQNKYKKCNIDVIS